MRTACPDVCSTPSAKVSTLIGTDRPGLAVNESPEVATGSPQIAVQETGGTNVTATWNDADEWLHDASVAVQVTVVDPTDTSEPDAGRQPTLGDASTTSVADGAA